MHKNIVRLLGAACICAATVVACLPASAQAQYPGRGKFQIDVDHANFYASDTSVFVELFYGIREHILTYDIDSGNYVGAAVMRLVLWKDTNVVYQRGWTVPHTITDTASLALGKTMVGIESFSLPPGEYRVLLLTTDLRNPSRFDSLVIPLKLRAFPRRQEAISDIELCSTISPTQDSTSMFYKNTLNVVPNASMLYGPGLPFLYYYAEVYGLTNPQHTGEAILKTTITNGNGAEVFNDSKAKRRQYESVVEQGRISLAGYRGGTYTLRLTLTDSLNHVFASSTKKFYVYRPGQVDSAGAAPAPAVDFAGSEFSSMTQEQVDREYQIARYIATEPERKQYEKLGDLEAKRRYMFNFWKNRNMNPASGRNDVRTEYLRRVAYADETYGRGFKQGWKTDRGRVYVIYGPPDEVEQFPSTAEANPYEVWHYNSIQGGVIFVFVDRNGMGQYLLVHSTHRDELHDDNWYQRYALRAQ